MTSTAILAVAALAVVPAQSSDGTSCLAAPVRPGGAFIESRFLAVSPPRAHEALEDAMQAVGVVLIENTPSVIRGERTGPRIRALDVPPGDEAVVGYVEAAERDGSAGTLVRVETRRRGGKSGEAKQSWSVAVLDGAACLLNTLGRAEDPGRHASAATLAAGASEQREVQVPDGTAVTLALTRFLFSSDLRLNQKVLFEVVSDVSIGPDVVIRRGAMAVARVKAAQDAATSGSAKARLEFEFVTAVSGGRIPVGGVSTLAGRKGRFPTLAWGIGQEFAVRAGTRFDVTVAGDQRVRIASNEH